MTNQKYDPKILSSKDIEDYLETHHNKSLLRFITCGSVDDGKSTLIGRLLYDSKMLFEDQLIELKMDSKKLDTQGQKIDFSFIVDGLESERKQGITIDVAYRFFTTDKRKFIAIDTPGHEQYTRNMVTGASNAELAIILIDARKGVLTQTRRHSYICHLLGINNFVLAVNKIDLVDHNELTFKNIVNDFRAFSNRIGIVDFTAIPISGLKGDNIIKYSQNTGWFQGPTLMDHLESIELINNLKQKKDFYMPVQWVNRPNSDFRGYSGRIESGAIKPGEKVYILPSEKKTRVDRIVSYTRDLENAYEGQSITLTLKDEIDCSRGQVIAAANSSIELADQFEATIIWMNEAKLIPGRYYFLKTSAQILSARISEPKHIININTLEKVAAKTMNINDIGVCIVTLDKRIPVITFNKNRILGSFIIIDKITNATIAGGLINYSLNRTQNIRWQNLDVSREKRAELKAQNPLVIWMTGLSGSGKSSIANELDKRLVEMNYHTLLLDGDNLRHGLCKDLGFTESNRIENIRRVGEVSKLMTDAGLIVIAAFISPFQSERDMVRKIMEPNEFIEIFIDTPLYIAEERDIKGLYAKARSGKLKNFTGIDSPYEIPKNPDIHIKTTQLSIDASVKKILNKVLLKVNLQK